MQGEDLIFLLSLLVVLPLFMTRMILNYKKWKHTVAQGEGETTATATRGFRGRRWGRKQRDQVTDADNSLTVTELEGMIRTAVADATEPMQDRLEDMERQLHALRDTALDFDDDDLEVDDSHAVSDKTLGRRRER